MKQFFKSVAATVVGIFAFGIIMGIFTFISLIGMLMSGDNLRCVTILSWS